MTEPNPAPLPAPTPTLDLTYASPAPGHKRTTLPYVLLAIIIVTVTAFAAFLMYLDRMCMGQMVASDSFKHEFGLSAGEVGGAVSFFFLAYALAQMPAGWFADRFRLRPLMTWLIALWSAFTFLSGFATGFVSLVSARIGCGIAEAGAYPLSGKTVPRWIPLNWRGTANAIISAGGRLGGAVAPFLTAVVITGLGTWRVAGWLFGGVGLLFALLFWFLFRDRPVEHPWCNTNELKGIDVDEVEAKPARRVPDSVIPTDNHPGIPLIAFLTFGPLIYPCVTLAARVRSRIPWVGLLCSRDMWLMCYYQCFTNVGWAFLVTLMPTFLRDKGLSERTTGMMASAAMCMGIAGMLIGGFLTDLLTRRFGKRQGRMIPQVWSRVIGAAAYLLVLRVNSAWACVALFGVVAAMTDLSIPATWGYIQDVGGRNVAATFAWPNMWGNLGAAATANLLVWINAHFDPHHNWHASMVFLAVVFLLSGVVALGIRADIPIRENAPA